MTRPRLILVRHGRSAHGRSPSASARRGARCAGDPAHEAIVAQARSAAAWLASLAGERGAVLAVTHGALRGQLAAALRERGWSAPSSRSLRHWSAWELTADARV